MTDQLNVYLANLPPSWKEDELRAQMSPFGEIDSVKVLIDNATQGSRGAGFVRFKQHEAAVNAIRDMNDKVVTVAGATHQLVVKFALVKDRGGGMGGGAGGFDGGGNGYGPMRGRNAPFSQQNQQRYSPFPQRAPQNNNVYVCAFPTSYGDEELGRLFKRFGPIVSVKVLRDSASGEGKGAGFVRFGRWEDAVAAIEQMNGAPSGGEGERDSILQVRFARDATPPSNLGGGRGSDWTTTPVGRGAQDLPPSYGPQVGFSQNFGHAYGVPGVPGGAGMQQGYGGYISQQPQFQTQNPMMYAPVADTHSALDPFGGGMQQAQGFGMQGGQPALLALGNNMNGVMISSLPTLPSSPPGARVSSVQYTTYNAGGPAVGGAYMQVQSGIGQLGNQMAPMGGMMGVQMGVGNGDGRMLGVSGMSGLSGMGGGPLGPMSDASFAEQDPNACLFVAFLPSYFSDADLFSLFKDYGEVASAKVILDPSTKIAKGYGFVNMVSVQDAQRAMNALNGFRVANKFLKVSFKTAKGGGNLTL